MCIEMTGVSASICIKSLPVIEKPGNRRRKIFLVLREKKRTEKLHFSEGNLEITIRKKRVNKFSWLLMDPFEFSGYTYLLLTEFEGAL